MKYAEHVACIKENAYLINNKIYMYELCAQLVPTCLSVLQFCWPNDNNRLSLIGECYKMRVSSSSDFFLKENGSSLYAQTWNIIPIVPFCLNLLCMNLHKFFSCALGVLCYSVKEQ